MSAPSGTAVQALVAALADARLEVRCQSLDTLGARWDARPALPHVLPLLEDTAWQVRSAAARALVAISPEDAEVRRALLIRALEDSHLWVRHAALAGLTAPGPDSADIQTRLVTALAQASSSAHRLHALQALRRLNLFSEPVLEALTRAAKDADWRVRAEAVRTLGDAGRRGVHTGRTVTEALRDEDPTVRETACEALSRMAPLSPEEFEALLQAAEDAEPQVRIACAKALGQLPAPAQGKSLQTLLRDADERVREAAVVSLGGSPHYRLPASLWVEYLEDPSPAVRQAAESVLADEAYAGTDLAPVLLDSLQRPEPVRTGVVHVLGRTGLRSPALVEPLSRTLLDLQKQATRDVAAHLAATDEATGLPHVLEGLRHPQVHIRHRAARALGFFVLDSAVATRQVPVLDTALRDPSEWVRSAATESLGRMGSRALPAYPGLVRRLFEHTHFVPAYARIALKGLRPSLQNRWQFPSDSSLEQAEELFSRLSRHLSLEQAERLRQVCLARERWHLRLCHSPPAEPPRDTPCDLKEAAARATQAAITHGLSRRRQTRPDLADRDREREFVWLLGQLHTIGLASLLTPPTP